MNTVKEMLLEKRRVLAQVKRDWPENAVMNRHADELMSQIDEMIGKESDEEEEDESAPARARGRRRRGPMSQANAIVEVLRSMPDNEYIDIEDALERVRSMGVPVGGDDPIETLSSALYHARKNGQPVEKADDRPAWRWTGPKKNVSKQTA